MLFQFQSYCQMSEIFKPMSHIAFIIFFFWYKTNTDINQFPEVIFPSFEAKKGRLLYVD